jgi:predicted phage terminase large subunit-like protein
MRRRWNSLYQQRPTDEEGTQFTREWFTKRHTEAPKNANWWVSGDFAVTDLIESDDPDWTALATVGIDSDEMLYFQDFFYDQVDPDVSLRAFVQMARRRKARQGVMEKGVIKNALSSPLRRVMKRLKWWIAMEYLPTTADKTAMAAAFRALAANGQVSVAEGPMGDKFIDQLCAFPRGDDDLVDMAGLIGRMIDKLHAPQVDEGVAVRKVKPMTGAMYKAMEEAEEAEESMKRGFYR